MSALDQPARAPDYPRPSLQESLLRAAGVLVFVLVIAWAWSGSGFELAKLLEGVPRIADFFGRMFPVDTEIASTVFRSTGETLQIALLGTFLSVLAAFPLGLLGL